MKLVTRLSLALVLILGVAACSTVSTRINEKASVYQTLDSATQAKIAHGDVELGYTPDMVYIARGEPDMKRHRRSAQGASETWIYRDYYAYDYPGFGPWGDWGWGGYYGGWHGYRGGYTYTGFHGWYRPRMHGWRRGEDDARITFQNGRVVAIDERK